MLRFAACVLVSALVPSLGGCQRAKVEEVESHAAAAPPKPPVVELAPVLTRAAPERLVAVGDLHGDLDHARRVLRLAGAIDERDRWVGGRLVVVQTGDEIDRGDDDRAILDLVEDLKKQAAAAGGELIALLGNHEVMNAALDFRYVTPGGLSAFSLFAATDASASRADVPADA